MAMDIDQVVRENLNKSVLRLVWVTSIKKIKLKELLHEFHGLTFKDPVHKLEFYCTEFSLLE